MLTKKTSKNADRRVLSLLFWTQVSGFCDSFREQAAKYDTFSSLKREQWTVNSEREKYGMAERRDDGIT